MRQQQTAREISTITPRREGIPRQIKQSDTTQDRSNHFKQPQQAQQPSFLAAILTIRGFT